MSYIRKGVSHLVSCAISPAVILASCHSDRPSQRNEISRSMIREIKASRDLDVQGDRARDLFYYVKDQKCADLDNETVDALISLLRIRHDGVRYWTVKSLSRMDPCARTAIPALKLIVPEADCWPGGLTSASEIRATLTKFGEPPATRTICTAYGQGHAS